MNRDATGLAGARHRTYETLGSTNAEALALARAGERGPLWITARTQSAGRGRRGSFWVSPPGNLYATLLVTEPAPAAVAAQLSFVVAVALHEAIALCAPSLAPSMKLKWPNDLLIEGKKVAGILIEAESDPVFAVAVGIGVNCVSHPTGTETFATDLKSNGANVAADRLLDALSSAMASRLAQWRRGEGFATIRTDWLKRAFGVGGEIRVRLPDRELSGRFQGLDEAGRLLLERPGGNVEAITAGQVFAIGDAT